jgi:hypothetical protein
MLILKFLISALLYEIQIVKKRYEYCKYIYFNLNFFDYLKYLILDKNINPIKCGRFKKFLLSNKKKWNLIKKKNIKIDNDKVILIDNFINQAQCSLNNLVIGKYLSYFYNSECNGLLIKGDIKGEKLFRSFGVNKFYYFDDKNIIIRISYIFKALVILNKIKNTKDLCDLKIKDIDIGLTTYDTFIRYSRIPSSNKITFKMIVLLAQTLLANDYFYNLFKEKKITKLVQAEKQFVPLSLLFQNALKAKKTIFTRTGTDKISVRIYNNFKERYDIKNKFSLDVLKKIFNAKHKNKAIKLVDKLYNSQFKNKLYGKAWAHYIGTNKKIVAKWKNTQDPNFKNKSINIKKLISLTKKDLCKINKWDYNKKIVTIFLPYMIDGNFQHGRKKLYKDNFSWSINTLNIIKKVKNVNWLIRQHPNEARYKTKINFNSIINELEKEFIHIKSVPENLNPTSIKMITDVAVTSHGSVGVEYPSFGKQCIVGENSYYTHGGFNICPKNVTEYEKILKKISYLKKIDKTKQDKAKIALFIFLIFARVKNKLIPEHLPMFEARMRIKDESLYWSYTTKKLQKFDFIKNDFQKMFRYQLKHNLRHTLDLRIL